MLLLDRIQDPGNLGTLIRTADAAGIDMIVMEKGTADAYQDKSNESQSRKCISYSYCHDRIK